MDRQRPRGGGLGEQGHPAGERAPKSRLQDCFPRSSPVFHPRDHSISYNMLFSYHGRPYEASNLTWTVFLTWFARLLGP